MKSTRDIPVIVLSSDGDEDSVVACIEGPVDDRGKAARGHAQRSLRGRRRSVRVPNILLMTPDTAAAAAAFRRAVQLDSTNLEARGRLRDIGQRP